jgi:hypothetical protein
MILASGIPIITSEMRRRIQTQNLPWRASGDSPELALLIFGYG